MLPELQRSRSLIRPTRNSLTSWRSQMTLNGLQCCSAERVYRDVQETLFQYTFDLDALSSSVRAVRAIAGVAGLAIPEPEKIVPAVRGRRTMRRAAAR